MCRRKACKIWFYFISVFVLGVLTIPASAQMTKVSGKIYDAKTREAMPFVNIVLKGTNVGTTSDFDGNFKIATNAKVDSLVVFYIGYDQQTIPIKRHKTQVVNVFLTPNQVQLKEVVIKPGENPAHIILRKVIKHKPDNNPDNLDAYQYEVYNKLEFDLNNISQKFKKSKVLKPIKFIFDNIDSTNVKEKPYLPLFMTETISNFYYRRKPKDKKEVIKASKVAGIKDASVSQFMGDMYQNVNIYDNTILVFSQNFISPISNSGLLYYKYYLVDSMMLGNHWCYQIRFEPKRKQEYAFKGNMWIADTTYAVKRLEMAIARDANINYIHGFNVVQDYTYTNGAWMLKKNKIVADFALRKNKMGIYGRKTTSYSDFVIHKPKPDDFYSRTNNLIVQKGADDKSNAYWTKARHEPLSKDEKGIYQMVDSIQKLPIYNTWEGIIAMFVTGYKTWGDWDIGPYSNILSFNDIEGARIRLGGRTSDAFSDWYELSGYVAYGTKDQRFKYRLGFKSSITKKPRQIVGVGYKNDVEVLGKSDAIFTTDNILTSVFTRTPLSNLTNVQQVKLYYDRDWFPGFNTVFTFENRVMNPLGVFPYEYSGKDGNIKIKPNIITSELKLNARFAYDEKYVEGSFTRVSMGTKYPILQVQYIQGLKNVFASDYNYHKLSFNIDDRIRINPIGYTDYYIEGGKIWGQVPYPLLYLPGGNETYTYDPYAYNMMNYYEFASDQYMMVSVEQHFDGFFFNRVPLLRKLKWRAVASGKGIIGSVQNKNRQLLDFPPTLYGFSHGPYYEAGVGVENIFKIFRIDALWRLSYLNHPNVSPFGIRGSLQLIF